MGRYLLLTKLLFVNDPIHLKDFFEHFTLNLKLCFNVIKHSFLKFFLVSNNWLTNKFSSFGITHDVWEDHELGPTKEFLPNSCLHVDNVTKHFFVNGISSSLFVLSWGPMCTVYLQNNYIILSSYLHYAPKIINANVHFLNCFMFILKIILPHKSYKEDSGTFVLVD